MIIEFLLSFLVLCITATICSFTSGGLIWELVDYALLPGLLLILALMIFLSGYGKAFIRIFQAPKKFKNTGLSELKKTEASLDYAFKALGFICAFLMLISGIYFYLNLDTRNTLGVNLAAILLSFFYLSFFGMIFITLKGKIKSNIIKYMAEENTYENDKAALSGKKLALSIIKILVSLSFIAGLYFLIIHFSTANLTSENPLSFYYLRDIPGIIYIFLPSFLLLTISGNFKSFFLALSFVIKNQKLSVTQKSISLNAISTLRMLFILEGIMATIGGFIGILFNLEDRSALGIAFTVACVPMIYALLINLILLPMESKISQLCDSE
ncbi:MAG: hypothetical protein J5631_11125 [Spirochaetaceae bacterium]|nr:hypothetical protein [Spirochaetaceae bacterium]